MKGECLCLFIPTLTLAGILAQSELMGVLQFSMFRPVPEYGVLCFDNTLKSLLSKVWQKPTLLQLH